MRALDDRRKYDFKLVLPRTADRAGMREIMRRGAGEYFEITVMHESRVCEVYVEAATDRTPPEYADAGNLGFAWSMSGGAYSVCVADDAEEFPESPPQGIDSVSNISAAGATLDDFCRMLESGADLPVINETGLPGRFDLEVTGGVDFVHDFTARMQRATRSKSDQDPARSRNDCRSAAMIFESTCCATSSLPLWVLQMNRQ